VQLLDNFEKICYDYFIRKNEMNLKEEIINLFKKKIIERGV
jgi:hypothetical protein